MTTTKTSQEIAEASVRTYHPDLHTRIAEAAYYKAEHRGFAPGYDLANWLEAEQEVLECEGVIHHAKVTVKQAKNAA